MFDVIVQLEQLPYADYILKRSDNILSIHERIDDRFVLQFFISIYYI